MNTTNYLCTAILGVVSLFSGCHKSSDKNPISSPQDATANVRLILEDFINANEEIEVVTGAPQNLAQQTADNYASWFIQRRLNNDLQSRHGSYTPVTRKFDYEISNAFDKFRVFIGMETFNTHVAGIRSSMLDQQYRILPQDTGSIEGYDAQKDCIVITASDAAGVLKTGYALSEYDKTLQNGNYVDVDGKIIHVTGYYIDVQTTIEKQ
ncbi:hypothetical protein HY484_03135 [Candidatus Woesearchaeota archaeon]|nr:hypothetical protein [Candidatus Woesearchaeota archaeon]